MKRDNSEDIDADGSIIIIIIIIKWIFKKEDGGVWARLIWLRVRKSGGLL
jgi:hypothetical protein